MLARFALGLEAVDRALSVAITVMIGVVALMSLLLAVCVWRLWVEGRALRSAERKEGRVSER